MQLDLKKIPIMVLNLKDDEEKRTFMTQQLEQLGLTFDFVDAISCKPKSIGCALSHLKALKRKDLELPFLVLEDDCEFIADIFSYEFKLPDATDALYLGHSTFGIKDEPDKYGHRWGLAGNVRYDLYSDQYIRVHNMLARHAIVYLSDRFHQAALEASFSALFDYEFTVPGDIKYAEMQSDYLVLATADPICFQAAKHGGVQAATRRSIRESIDPQNESVA